MDEVIVMDDPTGMTCEAIDEMRLELRAELRRITGGKFPPPGPADEPSMPPREAPVSAAPSADDSQTGS